MCSENDDGNSTESSFAPITISLEALNIDEDDTSFEVNGFKFNVLRGRSNDVGNADNGILLAFPLDGQPSQLELDMSNVDGVSTITVDIFNNAGSTVVSLWNRGSLVEENSNIPAAEVDMPFKETSFSLNTREVDLLRITSFEAIVRSITLE